MTTEALRRLDGRIAAERCLQASYAANDVWTRAALERCAARYMAKALGLDEIHGTATPGEKGVAAPLPLGRLPEPRQTLTTWAGRGRS